MIVFGAHDLAQPYGWELGGFQLHLKANFGELRVQQLGDGLGIGQRRCSQRDFGPFCAGLFEQLAGLIRIVVVVALALEPWICRWDWCTTGVFG